MPAGTTIGIRRSGTVRSSSVSVCPTEKKITGLGGGEREIRKHDRACNHNPNAYYSGLLTLQDDWVALFLYL